MQSEFIQQRVPKIFACNFEGAYAQDLLSDATDSLSQIRDGRSGKNEWNLGRKIQPLPNSPGGFFVFHTATTSVAKLSVMVGLTLQGVPLNAEGGEPAVTPRMPIAGPMPIEGRSHERPRPRRNFDRDDARGRGNAPYVTRLIAHFEGGGWDYGLEGYVDYAMQIMSDALQRYYPKNSGWYLAQGVWREAHRFQAHTGMPPDVPVPSFSRAPEPPVHPPRRQQLQPRPALGDIQPGGLRQALAAASPGSTLNLMPGTHRDVIEIGKPLTIAGQGSLGSVVLAVDQYWGITAGAHPLVLRNLVIDLSQNNVLISVQGQLILDGCAIRGGILETSAPSARLDLLRCSIENSSIDLTAGEVRGEASTFSDIEYEAIRAAGGKLHLKEVTFARCGKCAIAAEGTYVVLDACHIAQSRYGILARQCRIQLRSTIIATEGDTVYLDGMTTLEMVNTNLSTPPNRTAGA